MIDLWCAFDVASSGWGRPFVKAALDSIQERPGLVTEVVLDQPNIVLAGRRRMDQRSTLSAGVQTLIVLGTVCEDLSRRSGPGGFDWDGIRANPPDGLYHLVLWDPALRELRISSNLIGARPLYYWGRGGRWGISTTLGAFRFLPGGKPDVDLQALAEILTLSHPLEDRTLLRGVAHVPASHALVFSARGLEHESRRDAWSTPPPQAAWTLEDSADALEDALDRSTAKWVGPHGRVNISLTGGVDSRLLLPFVRRQVAHVQASTFGEPGSLEVEGARQISDQTGTPHEVCEVPANGVLTGEDLQSFACETEWCGDSAGPFYWLRWLPFLRARALPLVSGYLGDVLGGHRLLEWGVRRATLELPAEAGRADLARHPAVAGRPLLPFARGAFGADLKHGVGRRLADVYSRLPGEKTYARLMALDLSQRQRRYTCWLPALCESSVPGLHPFLSTAVIDTFARMPFASRADRAAVHVVLRRSAPGLLRVVDANTGRRIVHSSRWQAWSDAGLHNRYTRRIAALFGTPERLVLSPFRRLIRAHRNVIAQEFDRGHPAMADFIDLPRAGMAIRQDQGLPPYVAMRLYNTAVFIRWFYA